MASDKARAAIGFAKVAVALIAGYGMVVVWMQAREGLDEWYIPYGAGLIVAVMIFFLLSKLNKGSE